ncbi:hypothetical protein N7456_013276 [Penicillium angulare]|uniref:Uncharacterized protein n=1 Tax=Penicillium angulare TaxID=116970 RepID=A0A9W9EFU7_9EURO|nr:hypothetical protein N7456_013276 [Penicillium angulare]
MASSVATGHALPSPPPAYLRDSPPPLSSRDPNITMPRTIPTRPSDITLIGKQISITNESEHSPVFQNSPRSPVRIDSAAPVLRPSSVQIENVPNIPATPQLELPGFAQMSLHRPHTPTAIVESLTTSAPRLLTSSAVSTIAPVNMPPARGSWSVTESQLKDGAQISRRRASQLTVQTRLTRFLPWKPGERRPGCGRELRAL